MATPMTAAQFKSILVNEGCNVVEHRDWSNHNRNSVGPWGPTYGVVIHHTAGNFEGIIDYVYDGEPPSLPGPLAHGVITKDGVVHLVGWGRANHAGSGDPAVLTAVINESYGASPPPPVANTADGNTNFIGFECVNLGDGVDPWPAVQLDAMRRVSAAICRFYGWSAKSVIGHKEWTNTKIDPVGFTMPSFRAGVQTQIDSPPPIIPEDPGTVPPVITYAVYDDGSVETVTSIGSRPFVLHKPGHFATQSEYDAAVAGVQATIDAARAARATTQNTNLKADYDGLKALGVSEASARRMSQYTGP